MKFLSVIVCSLSQDAFVSGRWVYELQPNVRHILHTYIHIIPIIHTLYMYFITGLYCMYYNITNYNIPAVHVLELNSYCCCMIYDVRLLLVVPDIPDVSRPIESLSEKEWEDIHIYFKNVSHLFSTEKVYQELYTLFSSTFRSPFLCNVMLRINS